jgi:hypothetical protein
MPIGYTASRCRLPHANNEAYAQKCSWSMTRHVQYCKSPAPRPSHACRRISSVAATVHKTLSLGQWPEGIVSFSTATTQTQSTGSITWQAPKPTCALHDTRLQPTCALQDTHLQRSEEQGTQEKGLVDCFNPAVCSKPVRLSPQTALQCYEPSEAADAKALLSNRL